jgi:hypothetical protein
MTVLADLYEDEWGPDVTPPADRGEISTTLQHHWWHDGYVVIPRLIPGDLIDRYKDEWVVYSPAPGGWPDPIPYMRHPALRDLVTCEPLAEVLEELTGEPMGVHLNLTGWVSTERDWHADQYLNEPFVGGYYTAVWIALDDIHPDSGPFQYVPGSHRWPPVSQAKIRHLLGDKGDTPDWPKYSEAILTELYEQKIREEGLTIESHIPKRGTCLVWHGRLLHRGSVANTWGMTRRSCIAHFSGIRHRPDMPAAVRHGGGWLFPIGGPL